MKLGIDKYTERFKNWVNSQIDKKHAEFIGSAPETLDTIAEVAQAIKDNETVVEALNAAIGNKQDKLISGKNIKQINGQDILGEGNIEIKSSSGDGIITVSTEKELGALDVPLGTVASVVKEGYEITDSLTNHVGHILKEIIIQPEEIDNFEEIIELYDSYNYFKLSGETMGGEFGIRIMNDDNDETFIILYYGHYISYLVKIYSNKVEKNDAQINNLSSVLRDETIVITSKTEDPNLIPIFNKLVKGVFLIPSEVSTYVKSEKGLDLPIPRKFSDFGAQPELFPKEDRIVKNFNIIGEKISGGEITFETVGGTTIRVSTMGTEWGIRYDDSDDIKILDNVELQKFKDLVNSTTVYYTCRGGTSDFTYNLDSMFSADFPLPNSVELKTWKRVYTEKDVISESKVLDICNEVFSGNYYCGEEGIGEFDSEDSGEYYSEDEGIGEYDDIELNDETYETSA